LGKDRATGHNVWTQDPSKDGATHYNEVVLRALAAGWSRANTGSHIVRNNVIFNCEQAGICGSLGAVFSRITGNHIYNIWTKRQFTGAEMGGIKLHAAIDVVIEGNRIHNAGRGLWMDWMAQGTRITRNLCYDNSTDDLFVEVDHGPFLVDNNLFLSSISLRDWSEGGAYVHNLLNGSIVQRPEPRRKTPYHEAHSTALAGVGSIQGGDDRWYNNLFTGDASLSVYGPGALPVREGGNAACDSLPAPRIEDEGDAVFLVFTAGPCLRGVSTVAVTTALLGKAKITGLPWENPDGSPLAITRDYFGTARSTPAPTAGPFESPGSGQVRLKVW
ncbi:MAG: right-handed parallel beta-helix repeat-containing protein, partial [Acidobacteriota bacterium]|nr:right-handed parallel beta-helix repeat-containing protein [Acidobacteriota bacterium]